MNELQRRENQVMSAMELESVKTQIENLLGSNPAKMEAFKTQILNMSLNYGLSECAPESIISCGLQALSLGLTMKAGQGYVVSYKGKATFDVGYKGWQVLAKRAGYSVSSDVVYECDHFRQSGFGFNRLTEFEPSHSERKGYDDVWAKKNLKGVIVSIREDATGIETVAFVDAGMIKKIVGNSPSAQSEKGKSFSPHEKWAEQMFAAKAIKQVLSKFAIDLAEHTQLGEAMAIVNETEKAAQTPESSVYPEEKFLENYPKWEELVQAGRKKAVSVISQISSAYKLSEDQLEQLYLLKDKEPIDAEVVSNA